LGLWTCASFSLETLTNMKQSLALLRKPVVSSSTPS